jgi:hypothetical protein
MTLVAVSAAYANGILQMHGKVISLSPKNFVLQVGKSQLYTITRSMLKKSDASKITRTEIMVSLDVPMDAVISVRDIHANSNLNPPNPAKK